MRFVREIFFSGRGMWRSFDRVNRAMQDLSAFGRWVFSPRLYAFVGIAAGLRFIFLAVIDFDIREPTRPHTDTNKYLEEGEKKKEKKGKM